MDRNQHSVRSTPLPEGSAMVGVRESTGASPSSRNPSKHEVTLVQKLRYRYRLYPHPHQKMALAQAFGCARVVWKDTLALSQSFYKEGQKYPGCAALQKLCITQARKNAEREWLSGVAVTPLQQSWRDLDQTFRNWWQSKGRAGASHCTSKHSAQGIRFTRNAFRVEDHRLRLTKAGSIPIAWSRDLPTEPSSVTVIKDAAGRYCTSFAVDVETKPLASNSKTVGIDLGLASLAVPSDGEKMAPPKFLRFALKRLALKRRRRLQRSLNRKVKGSGNRQKARLRAVRAHATVADKRLDVLYKLSTRLIRENQTATIENLNVSELLKNRKLGRSIMDAGWRMFRTLLMAKAALYGREVSVISRWETTSRCCSNRGHRGGKKELSIRAWTCSACGTGHDRDLNGAKNILAAGLAERLNACGAERLTSVLASGCEGGTHLNQEVQPCAA